MDIQLSENEVEALRTLIDGALGDLSMEIADTDNAEFRRTLENHRDRLRAVHERLLT